MGTYFPQGLILQHDNIREADRLLIVFTSDHGLIKVIARGVRKITSKLAGNLEPITLADFMIIQGKYYDVIASSEPVNIFRNIKNNLNNLQTMQYICFVVNRTYTGNQGDQRIYKLLLEILKNLENSKNNNNKLLVWYFILRYISYLGYQPELYNCLHCNNKISNENNYFSNKKGGLICNNCYKAIEGSINISNNSIKIIRLMLNKNFSNLSKVIYNNVLIPELDSIVSGYLSYVTEQDLRIRDF
ncbi:MAG: DNA repair protein RecO [Candidatus Kerfeldbacteria bacterium]